jgi:hypothetical protein
LDGIERRLLWSGTVTVSLLQLQRVKLFREGVLNPSAHFHPVTLARSEVEEAIRAIELLQFAKNKDDFARKANDLLAKPNPTQQDLIDASCYLRTACETDTGALLWSYTANGSVESSPAMANGAVYVGSDDGNVYALNATTGALLWSTNIGGPLSSSPAVANGVVYLGSGDVNSGAYGVYALNVSSGALLWSYTTGGPVISSPSVVNGVVYVGCDDGNTYAFGLKKGRE